MNSVMLIVLRTIADELPYDGSPPSFKVDHVIAKVWDRNWKALTSAGFTPDDLRAIAVGAWSYAEKTGWSRVQALFREPATKTINTMPPKAMGVARAGVLELPSGRWAWIAPEHDGFVHVSLQMIGRSTERMEGAVREADFSPTELDRIARDPSIRWWRDELKDVTWEIRSVLRLLPSAARELTFSHVTLGTRNVVITEELRLGELTDDELRLLLGRAEEPRPDELSGGDQLSAFA